MICAPSLSAAAATDARVVSMDSTAPARNQRLDGTGDTGQFVGLGHALGTGRNQRLDGTGDTGQFVASDTRLAPPESTS